MDSIPAELISQRAADSNEYARALFHLEQHAQKMEQQKREPGDRTKLLERLQEIYANIDEPDGLEGISSHLPALDITQQILSHKKAGRWSAAKTWYEMELAEQPNNVDTQVELLNCLKQAGQHGKKQSAASIIKNKTNPDRRCTVKCCGRTAFQSCERCQDHALCRGSRLGYWSLGNVGKVH